MSFQSKNNLTKGINLDLDELRMPPDAAAFIKNLTDDVNLNSNSSVGAGSNKGVRTPLEGNKALTISGLPSGTNRCVGFYSAEQTNEGYFGLWNSNGNHTIWVIRGDTGAVVKVHQNTLLPFSNTPSFFLSEGRMTLELKSVMDPVTEEESNFKLLVFTNNNVLQCLIDVEASIATNSYTTSYFTSFSSFYDSLELIHLTPPLPIKCVKLNDPVSYTPQPDDANKQNMLVNQGWQFRIRTWDVFGRPSEWGIISSVFTSVVGGGCINSSNGLPRCVNLNFDAGNPLVKFITIAYRRGIGNDPSGQIQSDWYEHETFRKYDDSTGVAWYNRPLNPIFTTSGSGITFNAGTNIITYTFCADKGSNPIDATEASRTEPGTPRWSGGVFSINKRIGLANNVYGFEPINKDVTDAISFSLKTPNPSAGEVPCSAAPLRTIVVYANLYNAYGDYSPLIRNQTGGFVTFGDGGNTLGPGDTSCLVSNYKVGQVFADQKNPGFIAYLAGTPFKCIGEWGDYDPATGIFTPDPTFTGAGSHIKMTRFTFTGVPAGKYIARLASHHATINDGNLQQTSTQVWGVTNIANATVPWGRRQGCFQNPSKEIVIDCSTSNQILGSSNSPMFVILDLNDGVRSNGIDGYLYEEAGGGPVEMAVCYIHGSTMGQPGDAYGSFFTDHNGFYFVTSGSSYCGIDILAPFCQGGLGAVVFSQTSGCGGSTGKMAHGDGTGPRNPDFWGNFGSWSNKVYVARAGGVVTTYPDNMRRRVKQTITVCGQPGVGVPGIPVVMTKCQPSMTDSNGTVTIIAHNRYNYLSTISPSVPPFGASLLPNFGASPGNTDLLIFSQKGGCEWTDCNNCNTYISDVTVTYLACGASASGCTTTQPLRTLCLTGISARPNGVGIYGIQSGGKYPVAFWLHDVIGRHTAPQMREGNFGYVFVPNLNDTTPSPYPAMALCKLQVTIPSGLTVDPVFKKITFLVGANCLFRDFFSWGADWVQYVDNTGTTNTANPTAIRIYFQSLNEYNKQYNFGTNVAWDFIDRGTDPSLPRDVAQFIMNGDGTWLPSVKAVPVTYDKAGSFFTVDYIPELAGLQNGCLFKIIRPNQNTSGQNVPLYEQCLTLDVNNGVLPTGTWVLPYTDSYLLSRSIPVPRLKGFSGPVSPGSTPISTVQYTSSNQNTTIDTDGYSTNNVNNNNGVVIFQNIDDPITFPFFFESPSPSDLWGSHLSRVLTGRIGFTNPYEQQFRVGTEIALSNVLADKGIVNGIGTFLSGPDNKPVFDRNTWGDIIAVLVETSVCLVICERDHFTIDYNATQLQVTANGVVGKNQYGPFTSPTRKAGTNYGCTPEAINTIRKFAGIVRWLDVSGYLVLHNFSVAQSNTDDAGYLGYMLNKIGFINNRNNQNIGVTYFIGGIDVKTYEYYLTSFFVSNSTGVNFINSDSQPTLANNETLIFDLATSRLKSFASFTPEYFGNMPSFFRQRQFISFRQGAPYIHHHNPLAGDTPPAYCNFYGTQCEVRFTHIVNSVDGKMLPDKVKRFLATTLYVRASIGGGTGLMPSALFYADVIVSEKGQTSRLLVSRWDLKDGYQCAAYLCATNTPPDPNIPVQTGAHAILDGDPLQGRWVKVSVTNNPNWSGTYFELSEKVDQINFVEKSAE